MDKRYANERAFVNNFVRTLRDLGFFAQRIESGLTGQGIPDVYCIIGKTPYWLEFKRIHKPISDIDIIPWRPGQQAWLHKVTELGQEAYTVCCFNDRIALINHRKHYKDNVIVVEETEDNAELFDDVGLLILRLKK